MKSWYEINYATSPENYTLQHSILFYWCPQQASDANYLQGLLVQKVIAKYQFLEVPLKMFTLCQWLK